MEISHRYIPIDIEYHKRMIDEIKKHPGCCDNVWLTTAIGYPSVYKHKKAADELTEIAAMYRKRGISVSLQLANSVGHGQYMLGEDCSGLRGIGEPIVGPDGRSTDVSFCPRGKNFRKYIAETTAFYTSVRPDCFWIDDDFRLLNHKPVDFGCFCDHCVTTFNARFGSRFTREALVNEVLHGDKLWRERWLLFQREGMEELMTLIMTVFNEGSPDSLGGLQHAVPRDYIMGDHNFGFDPIYKITGKPPLSRPGGGTYNDHNPHRIIEKGIDIALQNAALPEYVKQNYPEVENIPHFAYGKTPSGTAVEASYYFACGATDAAMCFCNGPEPLEFYGDFMEKFASHRYYWERLSKCNKETYAAGYRYFVGRDAWKKDISANGDMDELNGSVHRGAELLFRAGLPITYDRHTENVYILTAEEAKALSDAEIDKLLSKSVITDGETVSILKARGTDLGVDAFRADDMDAYCVYEAYTDHMVNANEDGFKHSHFSKGNRECWYFVSKTEKAETLALYESEVLQDAALIGQAAELVITTNKGGKWALVGYQAWKGNITKARRDRLYELADHISAFPIPVRVLTSHQAIVFPRCGADGKMRAVSIVNCTIGKCEGLKILIKSPYTENFEFISQYGSPLKLNGEKTAYGYVIDIPTLDAWTMGSVFCI